MISLHILSHAKVLNFDTQFHFPWNDPVGVLTELAVMNNEPCKCYRYKRF